MPIKPRKPTLGVGAGLRNVETKPDPENPGVTLITNAELVEISLVPYHEGDEWYGVYPIEFIDGVRVHDPPTFRTGT